MFNSPLCGFGCSCTRRVKFHMQSVSVQTQQNESVCLEDMLRYLTNYSQANLPKQSHYSASATLRSVPSPAFLSQSPDLAAGGKLIVVVTSERCWNSSRDGQSEFSHLSFQSHTERLYKTEPGEKATLLIARLDPRPGCLR